MNNFEKMTDEWLCKLTIKCKDSESKWRLAEILRNQVLDFDYSSKGIVLDFSEIRRVIIFYDYNDETSLRMIDDVKSYMSGSGAEFGRII